MTFLVALLLVLLGCWLWHAASGATPGFWRGALHGVSVSLIGWGLILGAVGVLT